MSKCCVLLITVVHEVDAYEHFITFTSKDL